MGTRITVREALSAYGISAGRAGNRRARLTQRRTGVSQTTWLGLRGVFRKRWRAALTLLTLTLAGTTFLVVQTTAAATNQTTANAFANYHDDVLAQIYAQNAPLVAQISALSNVGRVERYREAEGAESQWGQLLLLGFQPDTRLYTPQLISGRWLSPSDTNAALINEEAATATGLHVGDTLTLSSAQYFNGQLTPGNQATWTIIGIIHQPMDGLGQIGTVITSVENANHFFGDPADLTPELLIEARDHAPGAVDALTRQVDQLVSGGHVNGGLVSTRQQEVQYRQQSWLIFYALLYSVALIVGAVGILSRVGFLNGRGKEGGMSNKTCFADTIERIRSRIASGGKYVLSKHIIAMGRNRVNVSAAPHAPPSAGAGLLELRHGAGEILWPHQCGGHPRSAAPTAGVDAAATLA